MTTQITNANQTDKNSLMSALNYMADQNRYDDDNLIPCRVIGIDRVGGTVDLQPMIYLVKTDNSTLARQSLVKINILSLSAGGFLINFPTQIGDIGWLFAGDRDLSLFKKSLSDAAPNSGRAHQFADGIFIPDAFRKYTIAGEDSSAMVIQNTSGSTKISIRDDNIKIATTVKILLDVPETEITGNVTIDQNLTVTGNTTVTGLTSVNGGFTAEGGSTEICALPGTATVNGINVAGHGHEQNGDSGRTSGGMEE